MKLFNFKLSKLYIFLIIIFSIMSSFLNITYPVIVGNLIDSFGNNVPLTNFYLTLSIIFILLFFTNLFITYFLNSFSSKLSKNIRNSLLEKLHSLPMYILEKCEKGKIINMFSTDTENISNGIIQSLSKIITSVLNIILATYIMLNLNFTLTFILILLSFFMFAISKYIVSKTNNLFKKRASLMASLSSYIDEFVSGKKTLEHFNYSSTSLKNFCNKNYNLYKCSYKTMFFSSLTNPTIRFISNLLYILIAILGIILCKFNKLTIGNISTFLIYTNLFTRPFSEVTAIISELQTSIASLKRILSFLNITYTNKFISSFNNILPIKLNYSIEFKNVSFSYTNKPFIENFNLYIPAGKSIAIVGKSGSGKTTIVNLLNKFYEVNSGEILIDNTNINNIYNLRKNIGMVLQDSKIFEGTIKENISYGNPNASLDEIIEASKLASAHQFITNLPYGYDTYISNNSGLSEGEVQLINIARIMLQRPPILIFDEATSNIDLLTENLIQNATKKLTKHSTSIIIAHRLSTIKSCDLIVFLENGKIVEMGTHNELLNKKGYYYNMYKTQFTIQ